MCMTSLNGQIVKSLLYHTYNLTLMLYNIVSFWVKIIKVEVINEKICLPGKLKVQILCLNTTTIAFYSEPTMDDILSNIYSGQNQPNSRRRNKK